MTALERLIASLEAGSARLRDGGLGPEEAAAVVERCAQDAAQASVELERLTRAAAADPAPSQDQLI